MIRKFSEFFTIFESVGSLPEGYSLKYWSEEGDFGDDEDWFGRDIYNILDEADKLATAVNIHPSRNQSISVMAFNPEGKVVGVLYDEVENRDRESFGGNDNGEAPDSPKDDLRVYDFSLMVDPQERGRRIGYSLACEVLKRARELECDLCFVWVVNPKMAGILEHLGFDYWSEPDESESRYSATMIKWM